MKRLKDKIVFITGASSGIGAACAKAFAAESCRLILCARRMDRLKALAGNLDVPVHLAAASTSCSSVLLDLASLVT